MRINVRTCTTAIVLLLAMTIQFLPLSASLPSAFEEDRSRDDLDELESMLSGEQGGSSYNQKEMDIYSPSQPIQAFPGPTYNPPYRDLFQNDTYFGDFIKQLYGHPLPESNQTWSEAMRNGTLHLSVSGKNAERSRTHFIKPILIEEPDF
jgi:hypothetical protein